MFMIIHILPKTSIFSSYIFLQHDAHAYLYAESWGSPKKESALTLTSLTPSEVDQLQNECSLLCIAH
jgi:hypothetical protein